MQLKFSRKIFEKHSNIKFHENPSNWMQVAPRGLTDGQTDMKKLTVAVWNFAKAPQN